MANPTQNHYTRLKDGSYGVRLIGAFQKGKVIEVTVRKRNGEKKKEKVRPFWIGNGRYELEGQTVTLAHVIRDTGAQSSGEQNDESPW